MPQAYPSYDDFVQKSSTNIGIFARANKKLSSFKLDPVKTGSTKTRQRNVFLH